MEQTEASLSQYGKSFQEDLCNLIFIDRPFADQIFEVLNEDFLELKYLRVFVRKIREHREKYKIHPSRKTLVSIIKSGLGDENEATVKQVVDFTARILSKPEVENSQFIKDTSLDFCRKQKLKEAMIKSARLINNSSFEEISGLINEAIKLGSSTDFGYDYLKDFERRYEIKARDPVTTDWKEIDAITAGGLGKGELGVVIAPTGAGKSMVLSHLGSTAVKLGKTVVHYTLELSDVTIAQRYDSCITKVALSDLFNHKDLVRETIEKIEGSLIVKEYPTKSASVETLTHHLERLKARDIKPDMIIVDYGDLLKPVTKNKEKRQDLESIYEGLRGMAQQFGCPIWTASQTNRSGLNAEVVTMESISEAFSKCFVADFIFSVSRTVEDKQTDTGRIFVAKNRFGPDGIVFPITMKTSNVHISIVPPQVAGEIESVSTTNFKSQSQILMDKYKKFRTNKKNKATENNENGTSI
jgi:archaellum biogenesis ATPase FlaH